MINNLYRLRLFTVICCISFLKGFATDTAKDFRFVLPGEPLSIYVEKNEKQVVQSALDMFRNDYQAVFGQNFVVKDSPKGARVLAATIQENSIGRRWANSFGIDIKELDGAREGFRIQVVKHKNRNLLIVLGSDAGGLAYGILELSRLMEVSPWNTLSKAAKLR